MKVTIQDLLKAGVHFGHKSERWNPKMKPYIFSERNGIYIIDLITTLKMLKESYDLVVEVVAGGKDVMFVGAKKQAKDIIKTEAQKCGAYYINERWLGGLLTNFKTVRKTLKSMKDYEKELSSGEYANLTKKEMLAKEREHSKKTKVLGGIKDMERLPGLLFVVDTKKHAIAIHEANLKDIPVIAITDTNSDPDNIDIPIPGNDDAIKSIDLITSVLADAVNTGKMLRKNEETEKNAQKEERSVRHSRKYAKKENDGQEE